MERVYCSAHIAKHSQASFRTETRVKNSGAAVRSLPLALGIRDAASSREDPRLPPAHAQWQVLPAMRHSVTPYFKDCHWASSLVSGADWSVWERGRALIFLR